MIKKNDLKNLKEFKKGYSLLFNKMSDGFALHEIILDKEGKPCNNKKWRKDVNVAKHTFERCKWEIFGILSLIEDITERKETENGREKSP